MTTTAKPVEGAEVQSAHDLADDIVCTQLTSSEWNAIIKSRDAAVRRAALEEAAGELQGIINEMHPNNGIVASEVIRWMGTAQRLIRSLVEG